MKTKFFKWFSISLMILLFTTSLYADIRVSTDDNVFRVVIKSDDDVYILDGSYAGITEWTEKYTIDRDSIVKHVYDVMYYVDGRVAGYVVDYSVNGTLTERQIVRCGNEGDGERGQIIAISLDAIPNSPVVIGNFESPIERCVSNWGITDGVVCKLVEGEDEDGNTVLVKGDEEVILGRFAYNSADRYVVLYPKRKAPTLKSK